MTANNIKETETENSMPPMTYSCPNFNTESNQASRSSCEFPRNTRERKMLKVKSAKSRTQETSRIQFPHQMYSKGKQKEKSIH